MWDPCSLTRDRTPWKGKVLTTAPSGKSHIYISSFKIRSLVLFTEWLLRRGSAAVETGRNQCPGAWEYLFLFLNFNWRLITSQYCGGFCHTLTWISHGCTCVPHPDLPSHLPPHPIPQGHPSAPALSTLSHASNLDWRSGSHMITYMFQCYPLRSSQPCLLPQSPKVCSIHLCLFFSPAYRVIITIFLNSIYMC